MIEAGQTRTSVFDSSLWAPRSAVSVDKTGIRCKRACDYMGPTRDIDPLGMSFQSHALVYHWSMLHIPIKNLEQEKD